MQLFYTPDIQGNEYILDETESKHCVRVLRKSEGDILHLTNGTGNLFKAEIIDANPKLCKLIIKENIANFEKRNYYLHLAVAPTKNIDRFEWFLEKATEIGVDELTPIITEHSERKQVKPERLERIIVSAMKQSIKAFKPVLNNPVSFKEFIQLNHISDNRYIAHCNEGQKEGLKQIYSPGESAIILIGPEGDFSIEEVDLAVQKGCIPISLGQSRLRTETAALVACHSVYLLNQ